MLKVHGYGVPLSSLILKKYCGGAYRLAVAALIAAGVIEEVMYPKGYAYSSYTGKSKLYRLTERYRGVKWVNEEYGDLMSGKLEAWQREENKITETRSPEMLPLRECLKQFTFDADAAARYVDTLQDDTPTRMRKKNARADAVHRIRAIQEGASILPFTYRENCGRLFTTYTNTPKDLLTFLKARDGSQLMEVDVSNSQPYFAAACAAADGVVCPSLDATARGDFYKLLMCAARCPDERRYEFKREVLSLLYDAPERATWAARRGGSGVLSVIAADAFIGVFPELWRWVQAQKLPGRVGRELALRMQRAEGSLILRAVALSLLRDYPAAPIMTRHDSIICRADMADEVQRRIQEESLSMYGRACTAREKKPGQ